MFFDKFLLPVLGFIGLAILGVSAALIMQLSGSSTEMQDDINVSNVPTITTENFDVSTQLAPTRPLNTVGRPA